jgi:hypothetical protein
MLFQNDWGSDVTICVIKIVLNILKYLIYECCVVLIILNCKLL